MFGVGSEVNLPEYLATEASWLYRVVADMRRMPRELVDLPVGGSRDKAYRARLRAWIVRDTQ